MLDAPFLPRVYHTRIRAAMIGAANGAKLFYIKSFIAPLHILPTVNHMEGGLCCSSCNDYIWSKPSQCISVLSLVQF